MIPSFIVTFRETLEAALVVGIVLSYLGKVKQTKYRFYVYSGTFFGIAASVFGAILFLRVAGGFTGSNEQIFEGITMLVGAALLTTMIMWMMKQKHIAIDLENKVAYELTKTHAFGLFLLVFIAILREGIETVIFLKAASSVSTGNSVMGAIVGIFIAIILSYGLFIGAKRINIKRFFEITSVLLILFAAGLVAHGVHELQEADIIPIIVEHIWDINPAVLSDGRFPVLHEKGMIGSLFNSLFGYNGNPSLLEVFSYIVYVLLVWQVWRRINMNNKMDHIISNRKVTHFAPQYRID
jgi:high-affinity iron transporter